MKIVDHIIDTIQPFKYGEQESFKDIVTLLDPNKTSPTYRTVVKNVDDRFKTMNTNLMTDLSEALYCFIATDAWSGNHKNYVGFTASWFDNDMIRNKALLAVRRLKGTHSFAVVRKEISGILREFK